MTGPNRTAAKWLVPVLIPVVANLAFAVWHGGQLDARVTSIDTRVQRIERLMDDLTQRQLCPQCP